MKRLILSTLAILSLLPTGASATEAVYRNSGTVLNPQVDAVTFINEGLFQTSGIRDPYETFSTLYFTNKTGSSPLNSGIIQGSPGFFFHTVPPSLGNPRAANTFFNANGAIVRAIDPLALLVNQYCIVAPVGPSMVQIWATNIIIQSGTPGLPGFPGSRASIAAGPNGEIRLDGVNVDLTRAGLEIIPVWSQVIGSAGNVTNFSPDIAVRDIYWGQGAFDAMQNPLATTAIWNGGTANGPSEPSTPGPMSPALSIGFPAADSYVLADPVLVPVLDSNLVPTFVLVLSNVVKGAVFVGAPAGFSVQMGFAPGGQVNNPAQTINVALNAGITNAVTGQADGVNLFFQDTLASRTDIRGVALNLVGCDAPTSRPANYLLDRLGANLGNFDLIPPPNFFTTSANAGNPGIISDTITNNGVVPAGDFAVYSAFSDNIVSRPMAVPGGTFTNLPGRVRITAENLDLTRARIRAEGPITIQSGNLLSSTNTVIDSEHLSFNLDATSGNLRIQNLAKTSVSRLRGSISAWSGVWSNTTQVIIENYTNIMVVDTNVMPPVTNNVIVPDFITNNIGVLYHALVLDARALQTALPVAVYDLVSRSPNVVIDDSMQVVRSLFLGGESLTLNGALTIPGFFPPLDPIGTFVTPGTPLDSWIFTNTPNLLFFTNNGALSIVNNAHFGDDGPLPYSVFVNAGSLTAASIQVKSAQFENHGTLFSFGPLVVDANLAKLENGQTSSGGDALFRMNDLKFNNHQMSINGMLALLVTNALSDAGPGSGNVLDVTNGFALLVKPSVGDLLGTSLRTFAPPVPSVSIFHSWAGDDRGANSSGFLNNVALGRLALSSASPDPFFVFAGSGAQNAIYVERLDLNGLTDLTNQIFIADNLVIYFAAATVSFTPPGSLTPEEFLNGQFGNRLRWVSSYAGANSSVPLIINGQPHLVNTALFNSHVIDSDGDSIPNFFDPTPFATPPSDNPGSFLPPYTALAADYSGLFHASDVDLASSGAFSVTTTKKGGYSASIQLGQKRYTFSGKFSNNGTSSKVIPRKGTNPPLSVALQIDTTDNSRITGNVSSGFWTANLEANREVFHSRRNPAPFAGRYTVLLPGNSAPDGSPQGDSYGSIKVEKSGYVQLTGTLADSAKLSSGASLSQDGRWPLHSRLYSKKGQVLGWLTFTNSSAEDLSGWASWIKPASSTAKYYPGGFDIMVPATGSAYNSTANPIFGFSSGTMTFTEGNLSGSVTNALVVGPNNQVTGGNNLTVTLTPSQGTFRGSYVDPLTDETIRFNGVILQKQGMGSGYFLGADQSGRVLIGP